MKYLVETLGEYGLHDLFGRQEVHATRPSVVTPSAFIEGQRGRKLRILAELDDSADDKTLAKAKNEAELASAIADLPAFGKVEPTKPTPAPAVKPKLNSAKK